MELRHYANLLWRWSWLIILAAVLAGGVAFAFSRMQTPVYQASTQILIDQSPALWTTEYTAIITSQMLARTYAEMFVNQPVLEETLALTGITMEPEELRGSISVNPVADTQLIEVSVEHADPIIAAEIANNLATAFGNRIEAMQSERFASASTSLTEELSILDGQIRDKGSEIATLESEENADEIAELQNELVQLQSSYSYLLQSFQQLRLVEAQSASLVVQAEPAAVPEAPIRPRTMMNTILAIVVGAMMAIGVVFLIEYLDDTVRDPEEVSLAFDLPVIGFFTRTKNNMNAPIVAEEPRSPVAEAYRSLRSNVQFAGVDRPIRSILITSPSPEEGKTTVAANLAVVMMQDGMKVVLVDADMRRPQVHKAMGMTNEVGLTDYFVQSDPDLNKIIQRWEDEELFVVTAGKIPPNPSELLGSRRMSNFMDMLRGQYDMIIIDSPPVGVVTDPTRLASRIDGAILVVEPKKTKMAAAEDAVETLRRAGANLIGVVFNNIPRKRSGYYGKAYYRYQYAYSYSSGEDGKGPEAVKEAVRNKR